MKIAFNICLISVVAQCFVAFELVAEEGDPLRLFHEPVTTKTITNQPSQSPVQPEVVPALGLKKPPVSIYQYNGFMSSTLGKHFIINGTNLADLTLLELVFASESGRTLQLRTINGYVFTLALGESISVSQNLAKGKNE